ncbi:MarR family winged helix-turn-helix transcriptional regulator [Herbivorax sp. ANBcel31]|uniref:MarR family winged helix-turn-helix transcriptional regulator n=1 Tax=Herbivorax sp. ANBcel31 TaxID=3069754 RepID=UPI0027B12109|nr:MarR family winged helix-turn-helix transcriptional regulator [Herbivorax sp. ANBcel31]MDQ2087424.1 MarR family winged helix-turn-helix transcriptional regulator [Herbivorax sp. ANBcel31]
MEENKNLDLNSFIFYFMDEFKFMFFPEKWSEGFFDYSKNEMLVLLFLYRYKKANMTQICEYINAPLNTGTGVINRLENKEMVERIRSSEDRRIVQITLTQKAWTHIKEEMKLWEFYLNKVYLSLTENEIATAFNIFLKVKAVLSEAKKTEGSGDKEEKKVKKITIE